MQKRIIQLFEASGKVQLLDTESDIDIITGISGSGPAFLYRIADQMAAEAIAGEKTFGFLSYTMFGIAGIVLIAGILGLSTKILADSISAGLALHAASDSPEHEIVDKVLPTDVTPVQIPQPVQAPMVHQHQQPAIQQHPQQVVNQPLPQPQNPHQ